MFFQQLSILYLFFAIFQNFTYFSDPYTLYIRVGRDFSKWLDQLASLGVRTPLGKVTLNQNFRPVTADQGALIVFAKRYIRSKFQSCQIELKLKIQSLLILLISKIPRLSILILKCGFYQANLPRWNRPMWGPVGLLDKKHIYGSKSVSYTHLTLPTILLV